MTGCLRASSRPEAPGVFACACRAPTAGLGLSHSDYHRVVALVAERSAGLAMWVTTQSLAVELLSRAGTAEQRAELLPRLAAGELSAFAMTEAGAGADRRGWRRRLAQ